VSIYAIRFPPKITFSACLDTANTIHRRCHFKHVLFSQSFDHLSLVIDMFWQRYESTYKYHQDLPVKLSITHCVTVLHSKHVLPHFCTHFVCHTTIGFPEVFYLHFFISPSTPWSRSHILVRAPFNQLRSGAVGNPSSRLKLRIAFLPLLGRSSDTQDEWGYFAVVKNGTGTQCSSVLDFTIRHMWTDG